jgi:N-acetylneuraminic acid mutarotase
MAFVLVALAAVADEKDTAPLAVKNLPFGVHGHQAQRLGDRLVVLGGFGPKSVVLDTKTGEWTDFPEMTVRKAFFAAVQVEGKIYAIGGDGRKNDEPAVIDCFDPKTNKWTVILRSDRLPKTHLTAISAGNKIYVFGGFPQKEPALVYDVRTGELAAMQAVPGTKKDDHFHFMAVVGGKLHVLGGIRFAEGENSGVMDQHFMWDGKSWHKRAALPIKSLSKMGVSAVFDDKIYVFSGMDKLHHAYDSKTDSWSDKPAPIPAELVMAAAVVDNGRLHVVGGIEPREKVPPGSVLTYDVKTNSWTPAE